MGKLTSVFFSLLFCQSFFAFGQWSRPQFTRLSTNEGLSQSHVNAILKDSKGFMWFGTDEGLNKYDGYTFSVYKHYSEVKTSIADNFVYDVLEDKAGSIWIATANGLDKFDRTTDTFSHCGFQLKIQDLFQDSKQRIWLGTTTGLYLLTGKNELVTRFKHDDTNKNSLSATDVLKIEEDDKGCLWVATQNGLNKINPESNCVERYFHKRTDIKSIGSNRVRTILRDVNNTIWIGTIGGGMARYNYARNEFDVFVHNARDPTSLGHNDVLSLMQDGYGNIWAGTENGGISVYQISRNKFTTFGYDADDAKSLSNNSVYALYRDDTGNIWAGTYSGGVNYAPASGSKFRHYQHVPNHNSLSNNIVLSIMGDTDGQIWMGTDGGGLNRFDPKTGQFSVLKHDSTPGSIKSNFIISVAKLGNNALAMGYHRNGFDIFTTKDRSVVHYQPLKNNPNSLPTTSVNTLVADRKDNLWVGTWMEGLYFYDKLSKRVVQYVHQAANPQGLCDNSINAIYEDQKGRIWVGTENGLDRFDAVKKTFTHFRHNPLDNSTISSNTINCISSDDGQHLWVGTAGGLCRLATETGACTVISERDGLPNNVINGLVRDAGGTLWLSTNKGIARYNPSTKAIRNYDISDGLQGNEFKVGSVYQDRDGMLYFGGVNGFNTFYPDSIRDNPFTPPVYLTDFQIFNKRVRVGEPGSPLTSHISTSRSITLRHDQGVFSFEFAALNYTLPQKNQYAYKLEGFDKEWNYVGNKRTATYTNLDQGQYVFRVKGSNNDGLWNQQPTDITINVLPPYWATWWFRLLAVTGLVGSVYLFYRNRIDAVKAQKWALEQIVEERTERLHQEQVLNKMKSQFVSTASHEFRTPLATIQSSIDLVDLYLDFPPEPGRPLINKHLRIVEKEIGKFGNLLDDVLTIEKMNAGKVSFRPELVDLPGICTDLIATHFQARKDNRSVEFTINGQPRLVLFDEKLIGHALVNLLSNAFKFSTTNPGLQLCYGEKTLRITVSDHGIGIPASDLPHLFETFFRAANVSTIQGTGLGLFITKQAVVLHGGTIEVVSQENVGTTFTVTLPI